VNHSASNFTVSPADQSHNASAFGSDKPGRICYVTTRYPAISHTFIQREIDELRKLGMDVVTAAQHRTELSQLLTETDRESYDTTTACVPASGTEWFTVAKTALRFPKASAKTLLRSLRTGRVDAALLGRRAAYFIEAVRLWEVCSQQNVRHIHAHFAQGPAYLAMLASEFQRHANPNDSRWSWSFTMHGPHEFHDESVFALDSLTQSADYVICISDYARSQLMRHLRPDQWNKLVVHHCGVNPEMFTVPDRSSDSQPLRLLTVARFDPMKGHIVLLDAVAQLIARGLDVRLDIIGDGPTRAAIEQRIVELNIGDKVTLHGSIGQDKIVKFFHDADVFCLPSFGEGVPVVLMEAMACGLPVVTARIAGIQELVEHEESGFVVSPGRPDLVADAVSILAQDPELRARFGAAGRKMVCEQFDITHIGPAIAHLHQQAPGFAQ
jgi:colanic acid/amylovoran biosynthesis glycosyltransferase